MGVKNPLLLTLAVAPGGPPKLACPPLACRTLGMVRRRHMAHTCWHRRGQVLESVLVAAMRRLCTLPGEENGRGGTTCSQDKKIRGDMGINAFSVAVGHASRAHQGPTTGTPKERKNSKYEAAERQAGSLATPNVKEVCHLFLPGPNAQESTGTTAHAQEEPPRVEGKEQGVTWNYST
ncbi:hypothetical protein BC826DRAFT_185778 [Russula brevipes]|nr:hypothetical protein BC826DRAFT_185778 [Russula brevipes]